MGILTQTVYYVLEVLKWIILARVLLSWLPMLGLRISPYNPLVRWLYVLTDPILRPLVPFSRVGMLDLSPLIAFFLIGLLQNVLVGRSLAQTIAFAVALTIAFSVHECSHAWVADRLGDPTARWQGRLTLDPRKHLDVLGAIMVLAIGFGWAKPVPVNPNRLRNGPKTGMAMVAAAGPLSNLAMAALAGLTIKAGIIAPVLGRSFLLPDLPQLVLTFIGLNVVLFVFNLIPIPPLDGFNVVAGLLPYPMSQSFRRIEPIGPLILLLLVFFGGSVFTTLITAPAQLLLGWLV